MEAGDADEEVGGHVEGLGLDGDGVEGGGAVCGEDVVGDGVCTLPSHLPHGPAP